MSFYAVVQDLVKVRADSLRPLDEIIYNGKVWIVDGIMHTPATGMCAYAIKRAGGGGVGVSYYCGTMVEKIGPVTDVIL